MHIAIHMYILYVRKTATNVYSYSIANRKRSIVSQKLASRRRLLVTPSQLLQQARYNFQGVSISSVLCNIH